MKIGAGLCDNTGLQWQGEGYILYCETTIIYIKGRTLVPLHVRFIQTITHSKGSASIRQTERRNVLLQIILHLQCVYNFTLACGCGV